MLERRQARVKQQDLGKDDTPTSSDGPTDLPLSDPAVQQLPTSSQTQLALDQLRGMRRKHGPSIMDADRGVGRSFGTVDGETISLDHVDGVAVGRDEDGQGSLRRACGRAVASDHGQQRSW